MLKISVVGSAIALLSGCASTAGMFYNRPVVEDDVEHIVSTVSLSSDRRTVIVVTDGGNKGKFCAEPPPDTATGLKAALIASLEADAKKADVTGKASLNDSLETKVTVLAERTAALDAYRAGVYALCQYHLNGAYPVDKDGKSEAFNKMFVYLTDSFMQVQLAQTRDAAATANLAAASQTEIRKSSALSTDMQAKAAAQEQTLRQANAHELALEQAKASNRAMPTVAH